MGHDNYCDIHHCRNHIKRNPHNVVGLNLLELRERWSRCSPCKNGRIKTCAWFRTFQTPYIGGCPRPRFYVWASLTWRLDLLTCFFELLVQVGICIARLLPQNFKFAIILGEQRVDFGLVRQIKGDRPVYFFQAQNGNGMYQ